MHIAHFMGLKPATGLNTINNIVGLFTRGKVQVSVDLPIVRIMTRYFLLRELKIYLANLRRQDEVMSFEEINQLEES